MELTAPHDWQGLFARCQRWGHDRAEWERSKGSELTAEYLPAACAPATEAQPGTYQLKGHSAFPLGVFSNVVTIRVV